MQAIPIKEASRVSDRESSSRLKFNLKSGDEQNIGFDIGSIRERMTEWATGEENKSSELDFIQERALVLGGEVEGLSADRQAEILVKKANELLGAIKTAVGSGSVAEIQQSLQGQELSNEQGALELKGAVLELGVVVDALSAAKIPFNLNEQGSLTFEETSEKMGSPATELQVVADQAERQLWHGRKLAGVQKLVDEGRPREALKTVAESTEEQSKPISIKERASSAETAKGNEHLHYAKKIKIIPDTHGLSPDFYGLSVDTKNVIGLGDVIDAPKNLNVAPPFNREAARKRYLDNLQQFGHIPGRGEITAPEQVEQLLDQVQSNYELKNEAAQSIDIKKNVEVWTELMKTGKGELVLGNHELMAMAGLEGDDHALSQWLLESNKGRTTLEAFGIDTSSMPEPQIEERTDSQGNAIKVLKPLEAEICQTIREQINTSPELNDFFDQLFDKGKMYVIANKALAVHAGIPLGSDGRLIPPQRKGKSWQGFENIKGLDALDKIEEGIRNRDKNILHWLGSGSSKEMSPAWVRDPFFKVMQDSSAARKAMSGLREQAKQRGGDVKVIIVGHTENVGGKMIGEYVMGADTAVGDIVELDASSEGKVQIKARHNFGKAGNLQYPLTKAA